uniref:Putative secreted protein n=1 Tax=Anopheles darlingi TaxID=43151 RepID=A0A2M4D3T8_ANODA
MLAFQLSPQAFLISLCLCVSPRRCNLNNFLFLRKPHSANVFMNCSLLHRHHPIAPLRHVEDCQCACVRKEVDLLPVNTNLKGC